MDLREIWDRQYSVISIRAMDLGSEDMHSNSSSAMTELANSEQMLTSLSLNSFTYQKVKGLDYT